MARPVKCNSCGEFDQREEMERNEKGKYFHKGECYVKHLEHRRFVEKENKEWDELYKYIKELHGIPDGINIPSFPVRRLQALRNGDDIIEGKSEKRYKQGASYKLILDAYKLQEDKIKWFINTVLKGSIEAKDINAVITMAIKGLAEAWRLNEMKKKREIIKVDMIADLKEEIKEERQYNYKRKKTEDISDYL